MPNTTKMGQSIEKLVYDIIASNLAMQDAIYKGYANLSALARLLKKVIEDKFGRSVSEVGIVSALKRIRGRFSSRLENVYQVLAGSSVSVKTNVAKVSFPSYSVVPILKLLQKFEENFIHLSKSLKSITLVFDEAIYDEVIKSFTSVGMFDSKKGLAAITVHSPKKIIEVPGCVHIIYATLANAGVNIEDTTSCYTDTIIVVDMKDVERAFSSLTELITYSRRIASSP